MKRKLCEEREEVKQRREVREREREDLFMASKGESERSTKNKEEENVKEGKGCKEESEGVIREM